MIRRCSSCHSGMQRVGRNMWRVTELVLELGLGRGGKWGGVTGGLMGEFSWDGSTLSTFGQA